MRQYPKYDILELENGLKIITVPIEYINTLRITFTINSGYYEENNKNIGVAHYLEHLIATTLREGRLATEIQNKGIFLSANASTGIFRTSYYVKGDAKYYKEIVNLMLNVYINKKIDKNILAREKSAVLVEMLNKVSNKEDFIDTVVIPLILFGKKNKLSRDAKLHINNLKNLSYKMITEFMNTYYTPNRTIIIIAGKYPKNIVNMLSKKLSKLKNANNVISRNIKLLEHDTGNFVFLNHNKDIYKIKILFTVCKDSDYLEKYQLYFLLKILNGIGSKSILFETLRSNNGLTYSPSVSLNTYKDYGILEFSFNTKYDLVIKLLLEFKEIIKRLKSKLLDQNYIDLALSNYSFGIKKIKDEISPGIFSSYGSKIFDNSTINTPEEIYNKYHKNIKATDLRNISKKMFTHERLSIIVLGKNNINKKDINNVFYNI